MTAVAKANTKRATIVEAMDGVFGRGFPVTPGMGGRRF
jgi:hypothetical protein